MIKLTRTDAPVELTQEFVRIKTAYFKVTKESVWREDFIKKALLNFSNNKCCYCETEITIGSQYLQVEHFHDKGSYPDEVLSWSNLLPSCQRCNVVKHTHDTYTEPIVDPTVNDPKDHFYLDSYMLRKKTHLGETTISALDLNEMKRVMLKRFKCGSLIIIKIDEIYAESINIVTPIHGNKKRSLLNKLRGLMLECSPTEEYSATCSTMLLSSENYPKVKEWFLSNGWWTPEFSDLESKLIAIKLDTR